jgi:hypothetical protein
MESDQLPRHSRRLLQLPLDFRFLPSKRCRVFRSGTHTFTFQTCGSTRISTESSLQNTESSLTPIPTIINGTPSTPVATIVAGPEAYTSTMAQPIVNASSLSSNPFGVLVTRRVTMLSPSLWPLVHFLMVYLTSLRSF